MATDTTTTAGIITARHIMAGPMITGGHATMGAGTGIAGTVHPDSTTVGMTATSTTRRVAGSASAGAKCGQASGVHESLSWISGSVP